MSNEVKKVTGRDAMVWMEQLDADCTRLELTLGSTGFIDDLVKFELQRQLQATVATAKAVVFARVAQ